MDVAIEFLPYSVTFLRIFSYNDGSIFFYLDFVETGVEVILDTLGDGVIGEDGVDGEDGKKAVPKLNFSLIAS